MKKKIEENGIVKEKISLAIKSLAEILNHSFLDVISIGE